MNIIGSRLNLVSFPEDFDVQRRIFVVCRLHHLEHTISFGSCSTNRMFQEHDDIEDFRDHDPVPGVHLAQRMKEVESDEYPKTRGLRGKWVSMMSSKAMSCNRL